MDKTPEWLEYSEGHVDITLSRPLEIDGAKVPVLRMREPTVADQRASAKVKGGDDAQEIAQLANLCEVTPADIDRLPLRDYKRLTTAFLGFID